MNKYDGQQLTFANLSNYLNGAEYFSYSIPDIKPLLQNDYGEANDCTLTSITTVLSWMLPQIDVKTIYYLVENFARKYGYTGKNGTNPLVIKTIYQKILNYFQLPFVAKSHYLKNIGYTFDYIKNQVMTKPILLNLSSDGRKYYCNHSVLIIGYCEAVNGKLLIVYDNWSKQYSLIDFNKLSVFSSIQTLKSKV